MQKLVGPEDTVQLVLAVKACESSAGVPTLLKPQIFKQSSVVGLNEPLTTPEDRSPAVCAPPVGIGVR
jgi:hypothetical protein